MPVTTIAISDDRKAFLHGVFTTALEGGIGYWSVADKYVWMLPKDQAETDKHGYRPADINNFYALLGPNTDDGEWNIWDGDEDKQLLRLDATVMHRGIKLFNRYCRGEIKHTGAPIPEGEQRDLPDTHYWRQWQVADATNGDSGDFDAEVADQIVQFGLFGEVVFG